MTEDVPDLLKPVQKEQLAQELAKILTADSGQLEIQIKDSRLHRLLPGPRWVNPDYRPSYPHPVAGLDEMLGAWREAFYLALAEIMGAVHGSLLIQTEHGQVRALVPVLSLRARTGKTGELKQ